jgi:branched-subunit amino acid transport protein
MNTFIVRIVFFHLQKFLNSVVKLVFGFLPVCILWQMARLDPDYRTFHFSSLCQTLSPNFVASLRL